MLALQVARAAGFTQNRVPPVRDLRAIVEKKPGLGGIEARKELVTRAEAEAFARQPPPRGLPANIKRYRERATGGGIGGIGIPFALVGAGLAFGFGHQAYWSGKGLWTMDWFGVPFGLLFVVIGAPFGFHYVRTRYRLRRLLRHGRPGTAVIESVVPTGTRINDTVFYRLKAVHHVEGRNVRAWGTIIGSGAERAQKLAEAGKPANILYDPAAPERILFVDDLISVATELEP